MDISLNVPDAEICDHACLAPESVEVTPIQPGSEPNLSQTQPSDDNNLVTNLWTLVNTDLAKVLTTSVYNVWIKPLKARAQGHVIYLETTDRFFYNWVRDNYLHDIEDSVQRLRQTAGLPEATVELSPPPTSLAGPAAPASSAPSASLISTEPQAPLSPPKNAKRVTEGPLRINPDFTFPNFVPGDSNRLAYEAARAFARDEKLGVDILMINAGAGLGKSHLVQALAQKYLASWPNKRVFYLTAESFTKEMVYCLHHQQMADFKDKYRLGCDLLIIEAFCFMNEKIKFQEEFNYTLEILLNHGKKIILTSTKNFRSLNRLTPQLKSKVGSALHTPINPPDYETRLAILAHKSKLAGLRLERHILELLAEKMRNDVRSLEGILMSISANSRLLRQPVSLDMAKQCLSFVQETSEDELSTEKIIKLVCQNCHIGETDIISKSRRRQINEARALGMYLVRNLTNKTFEEIGASFQRTHSSTLHAINNIAKRLKKEQKLKDMVDYLTGQLVMVKSS
ncbi:MAG: chromosomal replication initiator protein DnaA [Deltaproteobacteria bacterium]|jgi:chromosomal replication initiator protein|nr:chromosomal replication initiator protein DnaA [Deltaproteobacteria bacterium]